MAIASPDYLYLSAVDWTFRRLPHHYICEEIARRGGRTVFVENTGGRWPQGRDIARVRQRILHLLQARATALSTSSSGITIVPPMVLPPHRLTRRLNCRLLADQIRRAAPWFDPLKAVAWVTLPNWTSLDIVHALKPRMLVYFCADEFRAVPGIGRDIVKSEDEIIRLADLIIVTSERLRTLCSRFGAKPFLVPVGVDASEFADAALRHVGTPKDLQDIAGGTIGYLGGINHKIDLPLVQRVIRTFPDRTFVILGDIDDRRYVPFAAPNLRIVTGRPHEDVAAFLQCFDVCVIPYKVNQFTRSVYPAKLNEYLAAGRPVVSTALPETLALRNVIRIARTHDEFIEQIRAALAQDMEPDRVRARLEVAARNDYRHINPPMLQKVEWMFHEKSRVTRAV